MGAIRDFYNLQFFTRKSDKICIGIILERNFKLAAIFSGETSSGYKMYA